MEKTRKLDTLPKGIVGYPRLFANGLVYTGVIRLLVMVPVTAMVQVIDKKYQAPSENLFYCMIFQPKHHLNSA